MRKLLDRDFSWLQFNFRVLQEALNEQVPVFERLRFLAIYSANLDEFFRVRVGSLRNLDRLDKPGINKNLDLLPSASLKLIQAEVNRQLSIYGKCWRHLHTALKKHGIEIYSGGKLTRSQRREVTEFFTSRVASFLRPYHGSKKNGDAFLNNRALYFGVKLKSRRDGTMKYSYVNIPSEETGRFYKVPSSARHRSLFMLIDDVIKLNLAKVYPGYEILECREVKVSRNADLEIEDEFTGDLVRKIRKQLRKRNLGSPTRFLYDQTMSTEMLQWFTELMSLREDDLYPGGVVHNLSDYLQLPNPAGRSIEYDAQEPLPHPQIDVDDSILEVVSRRDVLFHFPYQRYDHILKFFNEAANNPDVKEIQVVFYRMAKHSLIGEALVTAAHNGKSVMVFMEIKARFDEENNLMWAQRFKKAGVKVKYSMPGLKVHAKIALIRTAKKSSIRPCAFFGTGNFNENTARVYTDYALLTSDRELTAELARVFRHLSSKKTPDPFRHLFVSQFNIIPSFIGLIDGATREAKNGGTARIFVKLNNLEEKLMVNKLYEASEAGVEIRLLVRGICCLRPQVKGLSLNIVARRIVDRYLEHSRIFVFDFGDEPIVLLGSADWMNRNLHHRIEVVFPIRNKQLKAQVLADVECLWKDNLKAYEITSEGRNSMPPKGDDPVISAQAATYKTLHRTLKKRAGALKETVLINVPTNGR